MKRGRGTGGGLSGPSSQWKSGEGHGERIVLYADVPEGIPWWVGHLAKHSSSRDLPSVQQDSLIAVCGEEPSAFPPLRDSSGIPGRKLISVLALFLEMDQFDLVWTTIPVMMLTGSKAPSMKASFWKGLCEAFKYFDLIPV